MSTLNTISEALRNLDSDSPVAQALAAVVGTEKSDSAIPLVDAAGQRMWDAFVGLQDGKSIDDVRDLLKSASALLLVASGDHEADYRTMSKSEFEVYAAGEIAKAAEAGIEGGALDSLRVALDVAQILFKGDNADRSFSLPLPITAAAPAADDATNKSDDAAAAEGGEGDAPSADDEPTGETAPAPAADAAAGEGDAPAGEGDAPAGDEVDKGDKPDADTVAKSDDVWPIDMAKSDVEDKPDVPEWGFDSPAADAATTE